MHTPWVLENPQGITNISENQDFIRFYQNGIISKHFEIFGFMVSVFYDFGFPYGARTSV